MAKQITIFITSLVIIIGSLVYTYREARAVVPLAAVAVSVVTSTGARYAANAAALMTGAIIANYIEVTDESNPTQSVALPLTDRPDRAPPAPSAPATATPTSPGGTYPAGVSPQSSCTRQNSPAPTARGMESTCEWCIANWAGAGSNYWCWVQSTAQYPQPILYGLYSGPLGTANPNATGTAPAHNPNPTCPSGYGYSSSQCTLSDARQVTPDGRVDYSRNGTTLQPASSNDIDKNGQTVPVKSNSDGSLTWTGKNAAGQITAGSVRPLADGGSYINYYEDQGNGTVKVYSQGWDATGANFTNVSSYTPGRLAYNTGTGATTVEPVDTSVANPNGTAQVNTLSPTVVIGGTGAAAPSVPIQFPSDYARQGEAQASTTPLATKLDTLHTDLSASSPPPTDPTVPVSTQFSDSYFKDTFSNLLAWNLPSHSGVCPTWQFDLSAYNLGNHTWDTHCTLAEQFRSQLSAIMIVVWILTAMFIVLGA